MEPTIVVGFGLMLTYIIGQFVFIFYSRVAYNKLRDDIISKGRLISFMPVLTLTTVSSMPGTSLPQQPIPGAPPQYSATTEKSAPPAYTP
ncbi:unnamed protein product [Ceutorhynchus assimilis]|uniref:Uncharacterized protein n=1 Tax=Ceutorhynchus assimilis TaxID=467358 RepID=A0A9N9MUX6_9CUCU|nr:unnamed protein product [Ceutorhynchus assimilis]